MSGNRRMVLFCFLLLCFIFCVASLKVAKKTYICKYQNIEFPICQLQNALSADKAPGLSQQVCLMTCGSNIWPNPTGKIEIGPETTAVRFSELEMQNLPILNNDVTLMQRAYSNFLESVKSCIPKSSSSSNNNNNNNNNNFNLIFHIEDLSVVSASIDNDESYTLSIDGTSVLIGSKTFFGARHGLETLSQLIVWDDVHAESLVIASHVNIANDRPFFKYRGVMVDVSRHFLSLEKLKESIRAMGYNKLNVLHLHLSDTASVPFTVKYSPNVTIYGAYDNDQIYSEADLKELQSFAQSFGVMLLPEIDTPSHCAAGWASWGEGAGLGPLVLCADPEGVSGNGGNNGKNGEWTTDALEPPGGQLNLANENVYGVLNDVYKSVAEIFSQSSYFHLGGDEVIVGSDESSQACYNSSSLGQPILEMLASLGLLLTN